MMARPFKITELIQHPFDGRDVDNCFFVQDLNRPTMAAVKLDAIFDWIKKSAVDTGLTVEIKSDRIVFIKGDQYNNK